MFNYNRLNPQLPAETHEIFLLPGKAGRPQRCRRTIAEPERQLAVMFNTHDYFSALRKKERVKDRLVVPRRSFDLEDARDHTSGLNQTLGYSFEDTTYDLQNDMNKLNALLIASGIIVLDQNPAAAAEDYY